MIKGLVNTILGTSPRTIQASRMDTRAGTQAIQQQAALQAQQANAQGYGLAAGSRGAGSPLAIREAQRQGAMAQANIAGQAAIQQRQLEQQAAQQNAQLQQQANQFNAQQQAQNDAAFANLVGAAAGAAMFMSDVAGKTDIVPIGAGYPALAAAVDDDIAMRPAPARAGYIAGQQHDPRVGPGLATRDYGLRRSDVQAMLDSGPKPGAPPEAYQAAATQGLAPEDYAAMKRDQHRMARWQDFGAAFGQMSDERTKAEVRQLQDDKNRLQAMLAAVTPGAAGQRAPSTAPTTRWPGRTVADPPPDPQSQAEADAMARDYRTRLILDAQDDLQRAELARRDVGAHPAVRGQLAEDLNAEATRRAIERTAGDPYAASAAQDAAARRVLARQAEYQRQVVSDERAKALEAELDRYRAVFGGPSAPRPELRRPDTSALDAAYGAEREAVREAASIPAYRFRYKEPFAQQYGSEPRVGVMAQDLERSPLTAASVRERPDGLKTVDTGQLTMSNTATLSEVAREIEDIRRMVESDEADKRGRRGRYALGGRR